MNWNKVVALVVLFQRYISNSKLWVYLWILKSEDHTDIKQILLQTWGTSWFAEKPENTERNTYSYFFRFHLDPPSMQDSEPPPHCCVQWSSQWQDSCGGPRLPPSLLPKELEAAVLFKDEGTSTPILTCSCGSGRLGCNGVSIRWPTATAANSGGLLPGAAEARWPSMAAAARATEAPCHFCCWAHHGSRPPHCCWPPSPTSLTPLYDCHHSLSAAPYPLLSPPPPCCPPRLLKFLVGPHVYHVFPRPFKNCTFWS